MKYSTRFLPTVNGPLHLGHLYTILVNLTEAQCSGGRFNFIFDNSQAEWNTMLGEDAVDAFCAGMLDDLAWLGIEPDYVGYTSGYLPGIHEALEDRYHYHIDEIAAYRGPAELLHAEYPLYPYTEALTIEKVILDHHLGINWLIRGEELITEDSLYRHYCHRFKLPCPETTYIPRLACDGETVSKTHGKYQIHQFREAGMTARNLVIMLERDCLVDPERGWSVNNIKRAPKIGAWADEVLNVVPA